MTQPNPTAASFLLHGSTSRMRDFFAGRWVRNCVVGQWCNRIFYYFFSFDDNTDLHPSVRQRHGHERCALLRRTERRDRGRRGDNDDAADDTAARLLRVGRSRRRTSLLANAREPRASNAIVAHVKPATTVVDIIVIIIRILILRFLFVRRKSDPIGCGTT